MLLVPGISAAELATRIALRFEAGEWLVLLAAPDRLAQAADEVFAEVMATGTCPMTRLQGAKNADEFIKRLRYHPHEVLLVSDVESFSDRDWQELDLRRDELLRSLCVALVATRPTLERMLRATPNLASWLGGALWEWRPDEMTEEETSARLQALHDSTGQSDDEVLDLARRRELPRDPIYAEWLVLLGRADLL